MEYEVWQNKGTSKKYLSYPVDLNQEDPFYNMEVYQFRKDHDQ